MKLYYRCLNLNILFYTHFTKKQGQTCGIHCARLGAELYHTIFCRAALHVNQEKCVSKVSFKTVHVFATADTGRPLRLGTPAN